MDASTLFCASDRVMLTGLKEEHLNGKIGEVVKFEAETGRYGIKVDGRRIAIKPHNLLALKTLKKKPVKLCKFGRACWRPDCHFVHEDEHSRAAHWRKHWQRLCACEVDPSKPSISQSEIGEDVIVTLKNDLSSQMKLLNDSVADIQTVKKQLAAKVAEEKVEAIEKRLDALASDLEDALLSQAEQDYSSLLETKLVQLESDVAKLVDTTASQHVAMQRSVQDEMKELASQHAVSLANTQQAMETWVDTRISQAVETWVESKLSELSRTTILGAIQAALSSVFIVIEKRFDKLETFMGVT